MIHVYGIRSLCLMRFDLIKTFEEISFIINLHFNTGYMAGDKVFYKYFFLCFFLRCGFCFLISEHLSA